MAYCHRCNNTGWIDCHCGGDLCICDNGGEMECPRCEMVEDGIDDIDHAHDPQDESRNRHEIDFETWLSDLNAEAKRRGHEGSLVEETGKECWRSYYDDGCTPKEAMDEEATYQ